LMIHAIDMLGDIGQPDAKLPKPFIVLRREKMRGEADPVQGRPKLVLAVRIVSLLQRRLTARRGAAEHQLQSRPQPVRQYMFLGHQWVRMKSSISCRKFVTPRKPGTKDRRTPT
jgi:hypothetical protein